MIQNCVFMRIWTVTLHGIHQMTGRVCIKADLSRRCFMLWVLFFLLIPNAGALSFYFPSFGVPIVTEDHLIFTEAGRTPKRLICISRESGEPLWEIRDKHHILIPWFVEGDVLVYTRGNRIYTASLRTGRSRRLHSTGLRDFILIPNGPESLIVQGEIRNREYRLRLVDLKRGRTVWQVRHIGWVAAEANGVLLCIYGEIRTDRRTRTEDNRKMQALSAEDGRVLWETEWIGRGIAAGKYFVVHNNDGVFCFDQKTGGILSQWNPERTSVHTINPGEQEDEVFAWARVTPPPKSEDPETDFFININEGASILSPDEYAVFSLSLPDLNATRLFQPNNYSTVTDRYENIIIGQTIGRLTAYDLESGETVWEGGQWHWNGVHGGGIYFSQMERDGIHTRVQRICVETGEIRLLYQERLPRRLRWPSWESDIERMIRHWYRLPELDDPEDELKAS